MKRSARTVQRALDAAGLDCEVRELPQSTRTAEQAAAAIGCAAAAIAKTIVFRTTQSGRAVVVIASGTNRIDESKVTARVGESIEKASPAFVRAATGFAIGGVPPCGHTTSPLIFIDTDLLALDELWAAAGTPNAVFRLLPEQLIALTGATVIDVK